MAAVRAFIALHITPGVRERLAAAQRRWRVAGGHISWPRADNLHLTLKFLGEVEEGRIPEICSALGEVGARETPFSATVAGAGGFPKLERPRVLWAGITDGAGRVSELAASVDAAMAALGFPREERPFSPHLTLGRVNSPQSIAPVIAAVKLDAETLFGELPFNSLSLMKSELRPDGALYSELCRIEFGKP